MEKEVNVKFCANPLTEKKFFFVLKVYLRGAPGKTYSNHLYIHGSLPILDGCASKKRSTSIMRIPWPKK